MLHNIYRENASNYVLKRRLTVVGPFSRNKSQMINIVKYIFIISTEDIHKKQHLVVKLQKTVRILKEKKIQNIIADKFEEESPNFMKFG